MAVLLALFSALAYGVADFVGGLVSRRASAWSVAIVAQGSSAICVAAVALVVGGDPEPTHFVWALVAGVGGGIGTGFLYRGLSSGRMGVVAPVSAVGAAVVPVVAGTLGGERPSVIVWLGILLALPAIWLVASEPSDDLARLDGTQPGRAAQPSPSGGPSRTTAVASGVVDGLLAGLGFGVMFAALGQVPDSAGLWPLALTQAVSLPVIVVLAAFLRAAWVPRGRSVRWALLAGPIVAAATGAFLLASQRGFLSIAGVLASLYPASTVLLAAIVLRERIHRAQGVGLGLCAAAVVMVAAG